VEHGVAVVAVMAAGTGGGSGVRSDVLFGEVLIVVSQQRLRNFLSVKVFKLNLEGDFKLLFFGGLLCS
jgi:hypothetical protein